MTDFETDRAAALSLLEQGDAKGAWTQFKRWVESPVEPERWESTWQVAASVVKGLGAVELGEKLQAAVDSDAAGEHFVAACALYEEGQYATAVSLLMRAKQVVPGNPKLLMELSACLEAQMAYHQAAFHLEQSGLVGQDPWTTYLFAFNSLMSGELERSVSALASVKAGDDDSLGFAVNMLSEMHARAQALHGLSPLDDRDLDGWHGVINNTVLLHESEHGHDQPMRGRFAYIADSTAMIKGALERLVSVLEEQKIATPAVFAAPDRRSQILGLATAKRLGVACEPLSAAGERPGLLVVYDLDRVGDETIVPVVSTHRPGQHLWVHAVCWVDPFPLAPEFCSILHQVCMDPWSGGVPLHSPEGESRRSEPDTRPIAVLADEILAATPDPGMSPLDDVLAIARGLAGAGLFEMQGRRARQRAGSVDQSNRFT